MGKCIFALANLTLSELRRSVEFLFEDELLTPDADIIRRHVDMNTTSLRPNYFPWELHRVLAFSYPVTCTYAVTVIVCA